jgi:heat shock protein HspQ
VEDASGGPVGHPQIVEMFQTEMDGRYVMRQANA